MVVPFDVVPIIDTPGIITILKRNGLENTF
jgi:hypothetical protein